MRACHCLEKVFEEFGIFRIGGDEFLVLCPEITKDELQERIDRLKEQMQEDSVNMAIGQIWQEQATTELNTLLQESEKQMYIDKAEYYKKAGLNAEGVRYHPD